MEVDLWVASSDDDADLFVYLEDFDPVKQKAKYVTEGQMRASHRKELAVPTGDHRAAAHLPGTNPRFKTNMEPWKLQSAGPKGAGGADGRPAGGGAYTRYNF